MGKNDRKKARGILLDNARGFLGLAKVKDLPADLVNRIDYAVAAVPEKTLTDNLDTFAATLVLALVVEYRFTRWPQPPMQDVDSSNIKRIGYDRIAQVLYVEFHSGRAYRYSLVPVTEYKYLLEAESVGKTFNARIKKNDYLCEQVQ